MATLKVILIIIEVLLLFNLLIAVHELGHFLAAKWRGLKIDRFAIWFGKPIWKKKIGGVEYALGTIPAGGYVALPQMATMEAIEGKSETPAEKLPPISALDKIIVAVAGPLFSFLLAVFFAVIIWGVGKPEQGLQDSTNVGWVVRDGPAFQSGLRPGDKILSVDGHNVRSFAPTSQDSVTWRIITSENPTIAIKYDRDGHEATAFVTPTNPPTKWYERKSLRKVMISPAFPAIIGDIVINSPAAKAGLRTNDEVIALNDERIFSPDAVMDAEDMATNHPNTPVTFTVRRGNEQFTRTLVPEKPIQPRDAGPEFGITAWVADTNETLSYPSPVEQIRDSAGMILATIGAVTSPKVHVGVQQLGGPVMIFRAYKSFFESENGWRRVLWFSVVLNVNLALLNMLPFPVLDGGHILLALIETIRRRPVRANILQTIQTACAILLIGFIAYTMFFDTGDWISSAKKEHQEDQTVIFAPK
jgi:regulator of sigma E protease